jgi:two-component system, response regulator FlrC
MSARVLVIESDAIARTALREPLHGAQIEGVWATDWDAAVAILARESVAAVMIPLRRSTPDGFSWIAQLHQEHPALKIISYADCGSVRDAVRAMQLGALDYLTMPLDSATLAAALTRKPEANSITVERAVPVVRAQAMEMVSEDVRSCELINLARRVARTEATVLLTGESGTGKEVMARYIHQQSPRAQGPFVAVNCAAIPDQMLEALLFGYEKGAFTGAHQTHVGKFEQAQSGTIFLDEISEIDLGLQAKLLRVLQEREIERLCGRRPIALDVRILAATNRSLREEVAAGRFREDLFYRLNVFPLHLVPLRDRPRDILPLAEAFVKRHTNIGCEVALVESAKQKLLTHHWPGNVRELENVVQRALILQATGVVDEHAIQFESAASPVRATLMPITMQVATMLHEDVWSHEQKVILETLSAVRGSRKDAAERLGISPRTLRYKLAKIREAGVDVPGGI